MEPADAVLRTARPSDAAAIVAIYGPSVEASAISFEDAAPNVAEMARRIEQTLLRTPWLVATNGGDVVGYAYAVCHRDRSAYRWAVDVSAYVHGRFQGRGVGTKLYETLLLVLDHQRFRRAYAGITLPNQASVALHRAVGFEPIGVYRRVGWKLGAWHDVAWFGHDIGPSDETSVPAEPIPFPSLISVERALTATADVRLLIGELDAELSTSYTPEQRHGLALDAIFQPHVRFFVARMGTVAVGCGGVALSSDFAEVKRMYVRPTSRGLGVADAVVARLTAEAWEAGVSLLRLETGIHQPAAIRFYERHGFAPCETFEPYASMPPQDSNERIPRKAPSRAVASFQRSPRIVGTLNACQECFSRGQRAQSAEG